MGAGRWLGAVWWCLGREQQLLVGEATYQAYADRNFRGQMGVCVCVCLCVAGGGGN